ncbi:MAG: alpha-L-arabinofuranosidase [Chthoniobacteraceae bacterium]
MKTIPSIALSLCLGLSCIARAGEIVAQPCTITVDASKTQGRVNPLIFGHNLEAADRTGIFGDKINPYVTNTGTGFWDPQKRGPVPEVLAASRSLGMKMLRYPGGCLAHNFDWRKAVGPLETRGEWKFGIDEFLSLCRELGAEPMFTVSEYVLPAEEMPAHAAELVEYLNAPATPDHPWAMKRQEWGHPEPYGVKWFELGNESDHGNHNVIPRRQYTPRQYGEYARATARAMRKVDPSIKIGIVTVPGGGADADCQWNRTVVQVAGKDSDFVVVHFYAPPGRGSEAEMMQACMAVGDQLEKHIESYHRMIRKACRRDLPLAVTEYNVGLPDDKPYRFSVAGGLECADLMRVFLKPENGIATANYWEFLNGYFGMIANLQAGKFTERPAFPMFRLWGEHFGSKLVKVAVQGPRSAFGGQAGISAAAGESYQESKPAGEINVSGSPAAPVQGPGYNIERTADGVLTIRMRDVSGKLYPKIAEFPLEGKEGCDYRLSFEARLTENGGKVVPLGLGLADPRGWSKTHSAMAVSGIASSEWEPFSGTFRTLQDASGVQLLSRLEAGQGINISGLIEIRNLKLETLTRAVFPEYSLLTSSASLSQDGKKLYVIIFNKSAQDDIASEIRVNGFRAKSAKIWEVKGVSLEATEAAETLSGEPAELTESGISRVFPAHSMTAVEFSK